MLHKIFLQCQQAPIGRSDHIMLQLLLKYLPVLKWSKLIEKCVGLLDESLYIYKLSVLVCNTEYSAQQRLCTKCKYILTICNFFLFFFVVVDDIQTSEKEVLCDPNNKPWITKDLKKNY